MVEPQLNGVRGLGWSGKSVGLPQKKVVDPRFCWFKVNSVPKYTYVYGETQVTFTKVKGVKVSISSGTSLSTKTLIAEIDETTSKDNLAFKVEEGTDFIITVYPEKGKYGSQVEFQYQAIGDPIDDFTMFFNKTMNEDPIKFWCILVGGIILICILFVCLPILICGGFCSKKETSDNVTVPNIVKISPDPTSTFGVTAGGNANDQHYPL